MPIGVQLTHNYTNNYLNINTLNVPSSPNNENSTNEVQVLNLRRRY